MEKKERAKQRPGMYFSTQQKHTIVKAFLEGGKSKQAIWKEFTGSHRECGKILKFMRQLGYIDDSVKKKPISFYMKDKPSTNKLVELPEKDERDAEIRQLKLQLEDSQIREQAYLVMIELVERELKINIRKKSFTK
ncbi:hypothetical protein OQX61_02200 [Pedobacter sp. PLR]|uniref:hypothetical protein n=1 Tax=Pedobacter sp. PLR TaxID=2994465 RepID=UPI00224803CF|nr:hypothetical protein [Pedobacter sp. PLR]MCX2450071.1 hypothetical protein [Pedobacter sp. PLR]